MFLIINSLVPVFGIITLGIFLKQFGWINDSFIRTSDRMIYYILFPCLLFWKTGKPAPIAGIESGLILGVLCAVFLVFLASLLFSRSFKIPDHQVGSFSQACYRFNSYIGMALIFSVLGEEGVKTFGVLIGFVIPFINVLAVSSMIWYSHDVSSKNARTTLIGKAMISNPLILACFSGIIYSRLDVPFPAFVENTFALLSLVTLPLALISIGGTLTLSGSRNFLHKALLATLFKLIILPVVGYICITTFHVSCSALKVAMIYFALPTSPQNYILSSQLNSDLDLATSTILVSTLLSVLSLSAVLIIFEP